MYDDTEWDSDTTKTLGTFGYMAATLRHIPTVETASINPARTQSCQKKNANCRSKNRPLIRTQPFHGMTACFPTRFLLNSKPGVAKQMVTDGKYLFERGRDRFPLHELPREQVF
jgi:hypothetical protein